MEKTENKNKKKYVGAFVFVLLVAAAFAIGYGTYAYYQSMAQGSDVAVAAKWKVKVNGANIVNQDKFSMKGQNVGFGVPVPVQVLIDATDSQSNVAYKITKGTINSSGSFVANSETKYSYVEMDTDPNNSTEEVLTSKTGTINGIHFYKYDGSSCGNEVNGISGNLLKGQTQLRTFCVAIGNQVDANNSWLNNSSYNNSGDAIPEIDNIESLPLVVIARQSSDTTENNSGYFGEQY